MKFLEAMKYQIKLQQLMLIAPFRVVNNRVESSVTQTVYILIMVSCFLVNIGTATHVISMDGSDKLRLQNGYLWGIIAMFELSFANISYPLLVIHTLIYRRHQIDFLNSITDIDETLHKQFGIDTDSINDKQRWHSYIFIGISTLYFWTLYYLVFFHMLPPTYYTKLGFMLLLVANQIQQGSMGLLTWTIIHRCLLIGMRFDMLQSIRMVEIIKLDDVKRSRKLMATWLTVYRDLCRLIEQVNSGWGFVIAWRYSHDFTLLISQLYLMYWMIDQGGRISSFVFVLYWSGQNVFQLLGMGLSAEMATRKVLINDG